MAEDADAIVIHLQSVDRERQRRAADAALAAAVVAVKRHQHGRFSATYADLQRQPRYAEAVAFFLSDLYGPVDFSDRDSQFARIVPALRRLFARDVIDTVARLAELHALSERLDGAMGQALCAEPPGAPAADPAPAATPELGAAAYARLWCQVGEPAARERQIALMLELGAALDRHTRSSLLRHSLRLMRGPATVAGLAGLQGFLERGFDAFRRMAGAEDFLATIASRERALAAALFAGEAPPAPG